jgi:hypothetical protein
MCRSYCNCDSRRCNTYCILNSHRRWPSSACGRHDHHSWYTRCDNLDTSKVDIAAHHKPKRDFCTMVSYTRHIRGYILDKPFLGIQIVIHCFLTARKCCPPLLVQSSNQNKSLSGVMPVMRVEDSIFFNSGHLVTEFLNRSTETDSRSDTPLMMIFCRLGRI